MGQTMNTDINLGLKGEYKIVIMRNNTIFHETDWFDNLILNNGLNYLGSDVNGSPLTIARVGTGNTPVSANQTDLITQIASANVSDQEIRNLGVDNNYATLFTYQYTFNSGSITTTIREAGIGWSDTGSTLFSRVVLSEPITLTNIDMLILYYRLKVEPKITDNTGTVNIGGTNYNYTSRVAFAGSFANNEIALNPFIFSRLTNSIAYQNATLGSVANNLSSTSSGSPATSISYQTYVADTKTRASIATWMPNNAVFANGINGFTVASSSNIYRYQMVLNNPVPKTDVQILTMTFRVGWDRL